MKQIFKILSLFILLLIMTAEDCSNGSSETTRDNIRSRQYQNIEEGFVNDEISYDALHAFELRAAQKVMDLGDLVTIYLDKSLPEEFRAQAKSMICNSFFSDEGCQQFFADLALDENNKMELLYNPKIDNKIIFKTDSIYILEGVRKTAELEYTGKICFTAKLFEVVDNDTIPIKGNEFVLPVLVAKKEKNFGDYSEKVWEVLLSENRN